MKLSIALYRDEDGIWIAECPAIPGCVSQGGTRAEALENVREAAEGCLLVRAENGMPLTVETAEIEVLI
jgi:predicted RNase H-like HicB family nuclease